LRIGSYMKAVILNELGSVEHFQLVDLPLPVPKAGEVRIRILAAGLNPVDAKTRQGLYGNVAPMVLGADCSGVIDALGEGVKEFAVGDEVYALAFGQGSNGTYAEYLAISTSFVSKKPRNLSFEAAASVPLVALTATRAIVDTGAIQEGRPILITGGTGGVGSFAIQLARLFGAGPIFSTAGSSSSVSALTDKLGLKTEHILSYSGLKLEEMQKKLLAMNGGALIPAAFDFVGKEMKQLCFAVADYQGHITSICPEAEDFKFDLWTRGKSIAFNKNLNVHFIFVGAQAFSGPPSSWAVYQRHLRAVALWIEEGRIQIDPPEVIGDLSAATIQKAHTLLDSGKARGKLVVKNG
jgi:NADPH2:quinone reductase